MKRVAILTDFISHDPAYSLCGVVANQVKMVTRGESSCKVIVRPGFTDDAEYEGADVVCVNPGLTGSNTVEVTPDSETEIAHLTNQLMDALQDTNVVLTHDMIYQPNMWKHHVAARRVAKALPNIRWLHWIHSATAFNVKDKIKQFGPELEGKFPNARIVVMHVEEFDRKRNQHGYEVNEVVVVPNPLDIAEDYHPAAVEALDKGGLWDADIIAVYPCRLDRGKQPHIILEIFAKLKARGADARVVIVDFHSSQRGDDKWLYRKEMRSYAKRADLDVLFTSTLSYPDANYHLPHKAVMDLLEFGDILIHPSKSESDPLILPEAAWKRLGLVLNFDLPLFRLYSGRALMYKFSSGIDVTTGEVGETETGYGDRSGYMDSVAGGIAYIMANNPVLAGHREIRQTRSLKAVWERHLWPAIQ